MFAHGTPLLGAEAHLARTGELHRLPITEQRARLEAPLGLRFEAQAGLDLLAARPDPTRERRAARMSEGRLGAGPPRAANHQQQEGARQPGEPAPPAR